MLHNLNGVIFVLYAFSRLKQCIKVILTMNNLNSKAAENEAGATPILGGLLYNIQVLCVNLFVYT